MDTKFDGWIRSTNWLDGFEGRRWLMDSKQMVSNTMGSNAMGSNAMGSNMMGSNHDGFGPSNVHLLNLNPSYLEHMTSD